MSLWFLMQLLMWPCLRHIVCTSSQLSPLSLFTLIVFPVSKICVVVIDVTVVLDVVLRDKLFQCDQSLQSCIIA